MINEIYVKFNSCLVSVVIDFLMEETKEDSGYGNRGTNPRLLR